jgi:putative ABC transport system permease protein
MNGLLTDLKFGARMIARTPIFSVVVIATLALVIGASATVFSVMHAVLWRPLPYPSAERLVVVDADFGTVRSAGISVSEAIDLREQRDLFDRLATILGPDASVTVDGEMQHFSSVLATDDALALFGTPLMLGRPLDSARDIGADGTMHAVVVSHRLWERWLGADPAAIGRHIEVNNIDVEVVGVLSPEFRTFLPSIAGIPDNADVWLPLRVTRDSANRGGGLLFIARLAPGVDAERAQAGLEVVAKRFTADNPSAYANGPLRLFVEPLQQVLTRAVVRPLWVLAGAIALVLVIGCVNIANLMMARARARASELAVRHALGAGRLRLARQFLSEAALLGAIGAVGGFALAHAGVALLDWLEPSHLPRETTIAVTSDVALFVAALALLVTVIFGLLPAFGAQSLDPLRVGRGAPDRPGFRRLQRVMVVAEVAFSIVPLFAAGLMLRTFVNLTNAPFGFNPDNAVSAQIAYSFADFRNTADLVTLLRSALERARALPGVEAAGVGGPVPFDGWQQTRAYRPSGATDSVARATFQVALPGYLNALGTRLLEGRDFSDDDIDSRRAVVIVDERIAAELWPDGALGQRLKLDNGPPPAEYEVIGVSESLRVMNVRDAAVRHVFLPYHVFPYRPALVLRGNVDAGVLAPMVKEAVESLGTRRPVFDIVPLRSYLDRAIGDARFMMLVLVGFAAAAVLLTAVGLYGTLAYLTSVRRPELGLRVALGATTAQIVRRVASEGLLLATIGAAIGFVGAMVAARAMQALLYGVPSADGVTLLVTAVIVAVTALVAAVHPAWRAGRADPAAVLHE